jgi:eukaryotic-like serine/threonine-protein kinase
MADRQRETDALGETGVSPHPPRAVTRYREGEVLLGRFQVTRPVGRGGMGEVYEVRDLRLHARVAMKTVREPDDPELIERLRREVQLARAVTHPNVCRVFDLHEGAGPDGVPLVFVTMEFLSGETLSGRIASGTLSPGEALPLLGQMAEGLAAIHAQGLVHRDFKPGNVMLVPDHGALRAVVTDFGIARSTPGNLETGWEATADGAVIGSPAYMAPEQRRGKDTTPRTDVYALALVACEMVTGRLPGEGGGLDGVPVRWRVPLQRALEAEPERRPADPRELVASLRSGPRWRARRWVALLLAVVVMGGSGVLIRRFGMSHAGSTERRSIAVLSLENLGSAPEDDYFGEGLAEDILTQLTRIRGLHVISRASTARFKGTRTPLRKIAEELGVEAVLRGSVRRAGGRVRITTQLVDASSEEQLWAETYDRDAHSVLDVQSDVASKVAAALAVRLTQADRAKLRRGETTDPQAYDAYLRGLSKLERVWIGESASTLDNAVEAAKASAADFARAVALDPNYATAHARLGAAYLDLGLYLDANNPAWLPKARGELDRALELEPALALPHIARARVLFSAYGGWNADAAFAELERARALDPDATHSGMTFLLRHLGLERALPEAELAHQLDPASERGCGAVLGGLQITGRWKESIARAQTLGPCGSGWVVEALTRVGRAAEALEQIKAFDAEHDALLPKSGGTTRVLAMAVAGEREEAEFHARLYANGRPLFEGEVAHHQMYDLACTEAQLGHAAQALVWLRKAATSGFPSYLLFQTDPLLDPIRSEPGFQQVMAELKPNWERWTATYQ